VEEELEVVEVVVRVVEAVVDVGVADAGNESCAQSEMRNKLHQTDLQEGFKMHSSMTRLRNILNGSLNSLSSTLAVLLLTAGIASGAVSQQKSFPSPEEAVKALISAAKADDTKALLQILGPEAKSFIETGDAVSDRNSRENFVKSYEEANALEKVGDTKVILDVGKDKWPLPIPLVKESAGWRFDTKQGKEEILNRRIGRNELSVMQVALAYVDAQREYYMRDPDGDKLLQYAQKFISTKGKRDGLYWETKPDEEPSPFGALAAQARSEGYKAAGVKPIPYHGYYYKILTGQGPNAPGGAYDYLVRGKMMGGFAMVAYPAQYGQSGIMTFMVNHDGVIYQKDLGPNSASLAQAMTKFNPDKTWEIVRPPPPEN
jgi:hypothetical protein